MTYLHAKFQGQQSVGSEDRVETNERTDGRTDVSASVYSCVLGTATSGVFRLLEKLF